jgi:putative protein-disulfide isomerase
MMKLVLVADPMCSWCYGFSQEVPKIVEAMPDLEIQLVMGGLSAGSTKVLDDAGKQFRLTHWARVEQMSGAQFNRDALMARKNFVYDSEPVSRAVVTARLIEPSVNLLKILFAFQRMFYIDGADTTDGAALAEVGATALQAQGFDVDAKAFLATWSSEKAIQTTRADFALGRQLGVQGFPTLFVEHDGKIGQITSGYAPAASVQQTLARLAA